MPLLIMRIETLRETELSSRALKLLWLVADFSESLNSISVQSAPANRRPTKFASLIVVLNSITHISRI